MSSSLRRSRVGVVALALGSFLAVLLLLEVALRLSQGAEEPPPPPELPPEWEGLTELVRLRDLSQPHARGLTGGVLYEANSHGFRGPERSVAKPPATYRIAVIGDSVTMGWGVLEEETYAALVEGLLAERHPGSSIEVLNLGLAGLPLQVLVTRFRHHGLRFAPDLVVYGFTINDLEGRFYRRSFDPTRIRFPLQESSQLARTVGPRWAALRDRFWPAPGSYVWELDNNFFHNPPLWAATLRSLDRLAEAAESVGACVVVLLHPSLHTLDRLHPFGRHYRAIREAAEDRGFPVVQPLPGFLGHSAREFWIASHDPHPNALGHRLLAEALVEGLESLPARCWPPGALP
ncbi:MAG: SGNH/GDSL hydrolase family protein [Myxococcota bacterium]